MTKRPSREFPALSGKPFDLGLLAPVAVLASKTGGGVYSPGFALTIVTALGPGAHATHTIV